MRDFTLKKYQLLLESLLDSGYCLGPVAELLCCETTKTVAIRHDVDRHISRALTMAALEQDLGIVATYYFRKRDILKKPEIIYEIASLNHEIGYHYENLSEYNGNALMAICDFRNTLAALRTITWADGVCAHGSPHSRHNNADLWRTFSYRNAGAAYELSLDIHYDNVCYLSDTGRRWDCGSFNIRDRVQQPWEFPEIKSTNNLIVALHENMLPEKIILNIHPQRWCDSVGPWLTELVGQWGKNWVKRGVGRVCGL